VPKSVHPGGKKGKEGTESIGKMPRFRVIRSEKEENKGEQAKRDHTKIDVSGSVGKEKGRRGEGRCGIERGHSIGFRLSAGGNVERGGKRAQQAWNAEANANRVALAITERGSLFSVGRRSGNINCLSVEGRSRGEGKRGRKIEGAFVNTTRRDSGSRQDVKRGGKGGPGRG